MIGDNLKVNVTDITSREVRIITRITEAQE